MGTFKDKENYLKKLCIAHPTVAHQSVVGGIKRNSFFRINNDEELLAATISNIAYPAVGYQSLRGRLIDEDDALADMRHLFSNSWMFIQHVSMITGTGFTDIIQECYDETFTIMEDFIRAMREEFEENGHCGAFDFIDFNKMNYVMVGPVMENEYGWQLFFDDEQKASRIVDSTYANPLPDNWWELESGGNFWELES